MSEKSRSTAMRRWWKPALAGGAGGSALWLWLEEVALFVEDVLALLFLPLMAGLIYLFDILLFKSQMPNRRD